MSKEPPYSGSAYLVLAQGKYRAVKVSRVSHRSPSLQPGEIAIRIQFQIPAAMFTRPQIEATVVIPDESVTPAKLDAKVLDNIRETIGQMIGLEVKIQLQENA